MWAANILSLRKSVGVPSTLITLSMVLEEYSGRRVGWTTVGA